MMTKSDLIDLDASYVHDTAGAWLLDFGLAEPVWIPKSQCEFDREDQICTMGMRIAIDKGLV